MALKLFSLLTVVFLLGGCACFQEPDFDKPLIVLPGDNNPSQNKQTTPENIGNKPAPHEDWVEAKTSRIWVSPHVDENGDYVEGYYKYIVLDPGHWSLNGTQANHG